MALITAFMKFKRKELSKASKAFKREFRKNGGLAHVGKIIDVEGRVLEYRVFYRSNTYTIRGVGGTLKEATDRFLTKLPTPSE